MIRSGNAVIDALASFGSAAVDPLIASAKSPDVLGKFASVLTLNKMISAGTVADPASIAKIRSVLNAASVEADYYMGVIALRGLLKLIEADSTDMPIRVRVDIAPGDDVSAVNLRSNGVISVALLGSSALDIRTIDKGTIRFGPGRAVAPNGIRVEDVNKDKWPDLVGQFSIEESGVVCADTASFVVGKTNSGQTVVGADRIATRCQ